MFFTTGILIMVNVAWVFAMLKIFTTNIGYYGRSGWNRCPSHFLTGFDSVDEAVKYLRAVYNLYDDEMEEIEEDITYRLYWFHYDRGEYEEAQKFQC